MVSWVSFLFFILIIMFGISEFSRSPYGQALGAGRRLILIRFAPNPDYDIESMGSRSILLDIKCIFKTAKLAFTHGTKV